MTILETIVAAAWLLAPIVLGLLMMAVGFGGLARAFGQRAGFVCGCCPDMLTDHDRTPNGYDSWPCRRCPCPSYEPGELIH